MLRMTKSNYVKIAEIRKFLLANIRRKMSLMVGDAVWYAGIPALHTLNELFD